MKITNHTSEIINQLKCRNRRHHVMVALVVAVRETTAEVDGPTVVTVVLSDTPMVRSGKLSKQTFAYSLGERTIRTVYQLLLAVGIGVCVVVGVVPQATQ